MTLPPTMRALVVDAYGEPSQARIAEMLRPSPGVGEVLIKAEAWSLNFLDLLMISGKYQVRPDPPFVPGRDIAGRIVELGPGVDGLKLGDRVSAEPRYGAFGEFVVAPEHVCIAAPEGLAAIDLAAAGTAYATVVAALGMRARLKPGEWVLLTGATGGVGSAGVQYARRLGSRVAALVSSAEKEAVARRLGAEIVLRSDVIGDLRKNLKSALASHGLAAVDAVVDMVGGDAFDGALRCLRQGGRCVIVGFASGVIPQIAANYLLLKDLTLIGSSLDSLLRSRDPELRAGVSEAFDAMARGELSAEVAMVRPLSQFAEAAAAMSERRAVGKTVFRGI
jgi:NADPH2:quinone reductase